MSESGVAVHAAQATRAELAERARLHYERLSTAAGDWLSTVPHSIDAWEHEPALIAEVARLQAIEKAVRTLETIERSFVPDAADYEDAMESGWRVLRAVLSGELAAAGGE